MARVTVEDCVDKIPNRYELLMVAAQRAKDISAGAPITVARDNDKNPVIALREIADETVSIEELQKSLVMGLQKYVEVEEPEEEELEIMAAEKELADLDEQFSGLLLDTEMNDGRFTATMTTRWIWMRWTPAATTIFLWTRKAVWTTVLTWAMTPEKILTKNSLF